MSLILCPTYTSLGRHEEGALFEGAQEHCAPQPVRSVKMVLEMRSMATCGILRSSLEVVVFLVVVVVVEQTEKKRKRQLPYLFFRSQEGGTEKIRRKRRREEGSGTYTW